MFNEILKSIASSLENLASNLLSSGKELFKQLGASLQIKWAAHQHFTMLLGKGVFS